MTTITKPSAPIQTSLCATQQIAQNKTVGKTKLFSPLTPKDLVPSSVPVRIWFGFFSVRIILKFM